MIRTLLSASLIRLRQHVAEWWQSRGQLRVGGLTVKKPRGR